MLNKTVIRVNPDEYLLAKLRRLNIIEKDGHGEFLWAQVGGDFVGKGGDVVRSTFKMYLDNEVEVPADFASKLLAGYPVPLDEPCPQCWNPKLKKSTGFTVAGICHQCKGNRFIDLNKVVNTYIAVRGVDGGDVFDPAKLPPPAPKEAQVA